MRKPLIYKGFRILLGERVMGIEPTCPAWKAGVLTIVLHPHVIYSVITNDILHVCARLVKSPLRNFFK